MMEIQVLTIVWLISATIGVTVQAALIWDERMSILALRACCEHPETDHEATGCLNCPRAERAHLYRAKRNGAARLVSLHDIRTDVIGFIILAIQVVIGVVIATAVFAPRPVHTPFEAWAIAHAGQTLRYGLIISIVLAVVSGFWKRYDRKQLFAVVLKEEDERKSGARR